MNLEQIKTASIDEVEERMKEIRGLDLDNVENIEELTEEVDALEERKKELKNEADAKKELRRKILSGEVETRKIEKPKGEERTMELTKENYLSSKEYRSAFIKNLMGKELTVEEREAIALSGVDPVIPTELQDNILTKAKEYAPVLNDITLLNVNGAVKFAIEGNVTSADTHAENANITASTDTLVEVELSTYEITKLVQISASVKTMTIPAFEAWLVSQIAEAIAMKIESLVFNGTGSSQAKGVDKITWNNKNSISVAKASTPTAQNIYDLVGLLKTEYARGAKWYMNRQTLFSEFLPLQDKSKNDLVVQANGKYYLLGIEVEFTDSIAKSEAILGNMKKYVANLNEAINVKTAYDINTNSYKYLGVAQFDGKPAIEEAFVKLVKASA